MIFDVYFIDAVEFFDDKRHTYTHNTSSENLKIKKKKN